MAVSRPSAFACVVWPCIGLVALGILVGSGGEVAGIVIGASMAVVFLFGVAVLVRTRVEVDGVELRQRKLVRFGEPVRLDRLTAVRAVRGSRGIGWQFVLADRDGRTVRLDGVNFSVARLWPVLAVALTSGRATGPRPSVDVEAARRIERARQEQPWWLTPSGLPERS